MHLIAERPQPLYKWWVLHSVASMATVSHPHAPFGVITSRNADYAASEAMQPTLVRVRCVSIECRPLEIEQNEVRRRRVLGLTCCRNDVVNDVLEKFLRACWPEETDPLVLFELRGGHISLPPFGLGLVCVTSRSAADILPPCDLRGLAG